MLSAWVTALPSVVRVVNAPYGYGLPQPGPAFQDAKSETAAHHSGRRSPVKRFMAGRLRPRDAPWPKTDRRLTCPRIVWSWSIGVGDLDGRSDSKDGRTMLTGMRKVPGMEETGHSHDASFFPTNWALSTRTTGGRQSFQQAITGKWRIHDLLLARIMPSATWWLTKGQLLVGPSTAIKSPNASNTVDAAPRSHATRIPQQRW